MNNRKYFKSIVVDKQVNDDEYDSWKHVITYRMQDHEYKRILNALPKDLFVKTILWNKHTILGRWYFINNVAHPPTDVKNALHQTRVLLKEFWRIG